LIGKTLSHFKITAKLGEGGMGEVYRATDTKLGREVAIKVLPEAFTSDPNRLTRFEREAKILASLSHPNIGHIYGIEDDTGVLALVLELIEGPTLADRIAKGPIPVDEALPIAKQIAEALEAAHDQGIIHRDLKPANINVREDGTVKVLDFGLAKAFHPDVVEANLTQTPTLTAGATQMGAILGTAPYMSPEQARGTLVDKRADIWAFGCVLYEMLTGKRPFSGENVTDTLGAILHNDPEWSRLPATTPRPVLRLLKRCMTREQKRRLQHIGDARLEIDEHAAGLATDDPPIAEPRRHQLASLALAAIAVAVSFFAGGFFLDFGSAPSDAPGPARFSHGLSADAPLALDRGAPLGFDMALFDVSHDGTRIVYVADIGGTTKLYTATLGEFGAVALEGTDGAANPFFSPDDNWIGYVSGQEIHRISLAGGQPETVAEAGGGIWGVDWLNDDIYFLDGIGRRLVRVAASGGPTEEVGGVSELPYGLLGNLSSLPNGRGLLAKAAFLSPTSSDYSDVVVYSPASREWKTVMKGAGYDARYAPSGHLVYARSAALWAVRFDLDRLEVVGDPRLVMEGLRVNSAVGHAQFALSDSGTLVFVAGADHAIGVPSWIDSDGDAQPLPNLSAELYGAFSLSPDGRQLAAQIAGPSDHLWVFDVVSGEGSRLTSDGSNGWPAWSPDGQQIFYSSRSEDGWGLYTRGADGSDRPRRLISSTDPILAQSWAASNVLAYNEFNAAETGELFALDGQTTTPLDYPADAVEWGHRFSHNGRWIAYASGRDGQYAVWLRPYPDLQPETKISLGEGMEAIWSADDRRLYFRNRDQWFVRAIDPETGAPSAPPAAVVKTSFVDTRAVSWDLGRDERILVIKPIDDRANPTEIRWILNWFDELKGRMPTG
jgi:serine/threonine-protein kinase